LAVASGDLWLAEPDIGLVANESTDELAIDLIGQSVDLVSVSREKPTRVLDAVDARAFIHDADRHILLT
jgi:hypothetical protein